MTLPVVDALGAALGRAQADPRHRRRRSAAATSSRSASTSGCPTGVLAQLTMADALGNAHMLGRAPRAARRRRDSARDVRPPAAAVHAGGARRDLQRRPAVLALGASARDRPHPAAPHRRRLLSPRRVLRLRERHAREGRGRALHGGSAREPRPRRSSTRSAPPSCGKRGLRTLPFDRVLLDLLDHARLVTKFQVVNGLKPERLLAGAPRRTCRDDRPRLPLRLPRSPRAGSRSPFPRGRGDRAGAAADAARQGRWTTASRGSTSRSRKAGSSRSQGRTAPARRRCCASSRATSRRTRARPASSEPPRPGRSADLRARVVYLSQSLALDPEMTSLETLRLFAALGGAARERAATPASATSRPRSGSRSTWTSGSPGSRAD